MAWKRKVTRGIELEICRLYIEGKMDALEIGHKLGIDRKTVRAYLNKNSVLLRSRYIEINPGDKFGKWIVIEESKKRGTNRYCLCECSCPLKQEEK